MKKVIDKAESRGRALYDWLDSHHSVSIHITIPAA